MQAALRERYPARDGWRVLHRTDHGVRLRRERGAPSPAEVVQLYATDPTDPDPARALFAALGRLLCTWNDPPGMSLVLVLPDAPAWCDAAVQFTVRTVRLFTLELLAVEGSGRHAWVRTLDLWGSTWTGGVWSDDLW